MPMTYTVTATVRDVMTASPITVPQDATIGALHTLMTRHGIAACPVVTDAGELKGVVSRVDILRALRPSRELAILDPEVAGHQPIREVMHFGVISLEPDDPLVSALDLFIETRLHALPVVHRGPGVPKVVGIVTQHDLLGYLMGDASLPREPPP